MCSMEGIVPSFGDSYMKQRGDPASQVSFRHGDYSSAADSENLCPRGAMPYACRGQISTTRRGLDGARQTHCHEESEGVGAGAGRQADVDAGGTSLGVSTCWVKMGGSS